MYNAYMPQKWECDTCGHISSCQKNHDKHLNQKIPCGDRKFVCECGERFKAKKGLNYHKKHVCKGPKIDLQAELNKANERCEMLSNELRRLENPETNDDEETIDADIQNTPTIVNLEIKTVITTDVEFPQIYFFIAGPGLIPLIMPERGVVIKFGFSDDPYTRFTTHKHDYKGGRLVDSVACVNPKKIESDFKKWMRATDRLVEARTENKTSIDNEIFVARSQEDYEMIVRKAVNLSNSLERKIASLRHELQAQTDMLNDMTKRATSTV